MRNQLDKIHRAQNKVNSKLYEMDYSNFAAMLPEKVVFTKNDLDTESVPKSVNQNRNLVRSN